MKKLLIVVLTCSSMLISAQSERSIAIGEWIFGAGFNTVNSLGTKNPFDSPSKWAFRNPISLSAETKWSKYFSLELALNFNGFKEGSDIDAAGPPTENISYINLDTSFKYYFGESILPNDDWIDFYGAGGVGIFNLDETNISFNLGGGVVFWLGDRESYGIRLQGLGKFALNHNDRGREYQNNHFLYTLQFLYRID